MKKELKTTRRNFLMVLLIVLALRLMILRRVGLWIERTVLGRLPMYDAVKSLSRGLVGAKEGTAFRPAVLSSPECGREIAYVIEEHGDGQLTVLVPWGLPPWPVQ